MHEFHLRKYSSQPARQANLTLVYEVEGTPLSDDYTPSEATAEELLHNWMQENLGKRAQKVYGDGMVHISWFVKGDTVLESAPFQLEKWSEDFLDIYSWPVDLNTGERINWLRLPVEDGEWNDKRNTKGGFLQEATGWKPAPLQPSVHAAALLAASGFESYFEPWSRE